MSMAQLRDDILRNEFSAGKRARLWEKVQKKVEQNANVRPSVREGRHGDVSRVWEWVGAVNALEGAPSGSRKRLGRVSWGGTEVNGSSPAGGDGTPSNAEMAQVSRKWDEGRPVY